MRCIPAGQCGHSEPREGIFPGMNFSERTSIFCLFLLGGPDQTVTMVQGGLNAFCPAGGESIMSFRTEDCNERLIIQREYHRTSRIGLCPGTGMIVSYLRLVLLPSPDRTDHHTGCCPSCMRNSTTPIFNHFPVLPITTTRSLTKPFIFLGLSDQLLSCRSHSSTVEALL